MRIEDGNAFMDYKDTCSCPTSGFISVLHQIPSFPSHRPGDSHFELVEGIRQVMDCQSPLMFALINCVILSKVFNFLEAHPSFERKTSS